MAVIAFHARLRVHLVAVGAFLFAAVIEVRVGIDLLRLLGYGVIALVALKARFLFLGAVI